MKIVKEWKQNLIDKNIEAAQEAKTKIKELREIHGYAKMLQMGEFQAIPTYYARMYHQTEKEILEQVTKDVEQYFKILQRKVEKKIGKIIEIEPLGGCDYFFKGENANCEIEVISAGGYNVQKWHTRWIVKKS